VAGDFPGSPKRAEVRFALYGVFAKLELRRVDEAGQSRALTAIPIVAAVMRFIAVRPRLSIKKTFDHATTSLRNRLDD